MPLGVAFALRSERAEGYAGLAVVLAILISAWVAAYEAILRIINPGALLRRLLALALAAGDRLSRQHGCCLHPRAGGQATQQPRPRCPWQPRPCRRLRQSWSRLSAAVVALGVDVAHPLIALAVRAVHSSASLGSRGTRSATGSRAGRHARPAEGDGHTPGEVLGWWGLVAGGRPRPRSDHTFERAASPRPPSDERGAGLAQHDALARGAARAVAC